MGGHCLSGSLIQLFLWEVLHISGGSSDSTFVNSFMPSTINLYQTLPSESPTENEQFLAWESFHFQPTKSLCWRLDFACGQFLSSFPPFADPFCTFALLDTDLSLIRVVLSAVPPENWGKACILGKSRCACPANRKANNEWTQQSDFPQLENMGQVEPL